MNNDNLRVKKILGNGFREMKRAFVFYLLLVIAHTGLNVLLNQFSLGILVVVLSLILYPGIVLEFHDSRLENRRPDIKKMFELNSRVIEAYVHSCLFIFLWSLLFVIPGVYKAYQYLRVPFIARDNPNMTNKQILEASKEEMNGKKGSLFWSRLIVVLPLIVTSIIAITIFFTSLFNFAQNAGHYISETEFVTAFFASIMGTGSVVFILLSCLSVIVGIYSRAIETYFYTEVTKERRKLVDAERIEDVQPIWNEQEVEGLSDENNQPL